MNHAFPLSFALTFVAFGLTVAAQSDRAMKPPKEFQEWMRSNTKHVAVDGSGGRATGTIEDALAAGQENFEIVYKDAGVLKDNFDKIEAWFNERKQFGDAVDYARTARLASAEMQRWAADGIWMHGDKDATQKISLEVQKAQLTLATACRNCHIAHRVVTITVPVGFEIR
jgi:hypothetical protein